MNDEDDTVNMNSIANWVSVSMFESGKEKSHYQSHSLRQDVKSQVLHLKNETATVKS